MSTLYANAHVVTMDDDASEHQGGWILEEDGLVAAVGSGEPPPAADTVDLRSAVVTPGLVNTHHHLWQNLTRARAQEENLFGWLRALYPVWAAIDEEAEYAAARAGLAELALSGCSTVFDHHYVFPRGAGDLIEAEMTAARELGVRLVPSRGSMDLGESDGGLPPDSLVEEIDDERNRAFFSRFLAPSENGMLLGAWRGEQLVGYACLYWHFSSTRAVERALELGTADADAVRLILEHRREEPVGLFCLAGRPRRRGPTDALTRRAS